MSIFVERLDKVGRETSDPIGFGTSSKGNDRLSDMIIIGEIVFEELLKTGNDLDNNVDAILVSIDSSDIKSLKSVSSLLTDRLWGVRSQSLTVDQLDHLKENGCDFIVFDIGKTPAILLSDESIGKIITLGHEVDNDLSNAINCLNLDCVLFISKDRSLPLTVEEMIEFQMVRNRIDKHFILEVPTDLEPNGVETLRNANISGLLIDLKFPKAIIKLKRNITGLPVRKNKPRDRSSPSPRLYSNH